MFIEIKNILVDTGIELGSFRLKKIVFLNVTEPYCLCLTLQTMLVINTKSSNTFLFMLIFKYLLLYYIYPALQALETHDFLTILSTVACWSLSLPIFSIWDMSRINASFHRSLGRPLLLVLAIPPFSTTFIVLVSDMRIIWPRHFSLWVLITSVIAQEII